MRDGKLNADPQVHTVRETPVSLLVDGDGGLGYFAAYQGTQTLIDKTAHFFEHYKDLEKGKWTRIEGWYGIEKARELIEAAVKRGQEEGA